MSLLKNPFQVHRSVVNVPLNDSNYKTSGAFKMSPLSAMTTKVLCTSQRSYQEPEN